MRARFFFILWALCLAGPVHAETPPGVAVVAQTAEPQALDPSTVTSLNDFRILANVFEGLVRFDSDSLTVRPALATDWEISRDGLRYTFHLRDDVRFHDGAPFNAWAVKFTFERMLDPDHPYHDTGPFPLAFLFEPVERVEALHARTVRFHLSKPFAPLLSNLAYPAAYIVSPAAVKARGAAFARRPSGTGPFQFDMWQSGIKVQLARNPDYWDGPPDLDAVIFRPLVNANTRVAELLADGVDVLTGVPFDMLPVLAETPRFKQHRKVGPHLWFVTLNMREGPFTDRRMRRAVNLAVDKDAIVEDILRGAATVASGPIPEVFDWAYNEDVAPYPHDPKTARALIEEAGYRGADLVLLAPEGGPGMLDPVAMATAIQADLKKVSLDVEIRTFEWNSYLGKVNAGLEGQADMAEMAWMTNDPDTLPYLALRRAAWPDKGGFNSGYYASADVDRLLGRARTATDKETRGRIYKRIHQIVHGDAPWLFGASWRQSVVTSRRIEGFDLRPSFLFDFHDVRKVKTP